jgi:hypothetical protein
MLTATLQLDRILRVLHLVYTKDIRDELVWHTRDNGAVVLFAIDCSDLFEWGCADSEPLTPDSVVELESACDDSRTATGTACWGTTIYCCRRRQSRPQGAAYRDLPQEIWPLLDACGPERESRVGNPHARPTDDTLEAARE